MSDETPPPDPGSPAGGDLLQDNGFDFDPPDGEDLSLDSGFGAEPPSRIALGEVSHRIKLENWVFWSAIVMIAVLYLAEIGFVYAIAALHFRQPAAPVDWHISALACVLITAPTVLLIILIRAAYRMKETDYKLPSAEFIKEIIKNATDLVKEAKK